MLIFRSKRIIGLTMVAPPWLHGDGKRYCGIMIPRPRFLCEEFDCLVPYEMLYFQSDSKPDSILDKLGRFFSLSDMKGGIVGELSVTYIGSAIDGNKMVCCKHNQFIIPIKTISRAEINCGNRLQYRVFLHCNLKDKTRMFADD